MWGNIKRFAGDRINDLKNAADTVGNELEYRTNQLVDSIEDHRNYVHTGGADNSPDEVHAATSWAGKPGQFANKPVVQNGLDAINKSGANAKGFADGNKNDLNLIKNYYSDSKNNEVLNQYDMSTNLYLRYLSGRGAEGVQIGPERTEQLRTVIEQQKQNLQDPAAIENIKNSYGQGHIDRINKGHIPVYFAGSKDAVAPVKATIPRDLPGTGDFSTSLGSFWAEPDNNGGYSVTDTYDFRYAPKSKGGDGDANFKEFAKESYKGNALTHYHPKNVAGRHAVNGLGDKFTYTLQIPGANK